MRDADIFEKDNFTAVVVCDECGEKITVTINSREFWEGKTGRVMCGFCGCVTLPCVICRGSRIENCDNCPFEEAEIVNFNDV